MSNLLLFDDLRSHFLINLRRIERILGVVFNIVVHSTWVIILLTFLLSRLDVDFFRARERVAVVAYLLVFHHVSELFLRTLQEFVDLALPLVLDWVVALMIGFGLVAKVSTCLLSRSLSVIWIAWSISTTGLNSGLTHVWSCTWGSDLLLFAFRGHFHVLTLDILEVNFVLQAVLVALLLRQVKRTLLVGFIRLSSLLGRSTVRLGWRSQLTLIHLVRISSQFNILVLLSWDRWLNMISVINMTTVADFLTLCFVWLVPLMMWDIL